MMNFYIALMLYFTLFIVLRSVLSCVDQNLSFQPSSNYSDMIVTEGSPTQTTAMNSGECLAYCVSQGVSTTVVYDPDTMICSCHHLPMSMLEMSPKPGASAFGQETASSDNMVIQWADSVLDYSSYYTNTIFFVTTRYPPTEMLGPKDFYPLYSDTTPRAWCPKDIDNNQFIELAFAESVYILEIHIYEIFNAGAVETVSIQDTNSNWMLVWTSPSIQIITSSRIFSPPFKSPAFKSSAIRLDLALGTTGDWAMYDAVRVVGQRSRNNG